MKPWQWYGKVIRQYADFSGRARRQEYWYFALANFIIGFVLGIIDAAISGPPTPGHHIGFLGTIYNLLVFLPSLGVSIRRLHDTNRSGWWLLINLAPALLMFGALIAGAGLAIYGLIVLLWIGCCITLIVFLASDGDAGDNRFGPDPKQLPDGVVPPDPRP